MSTRATVGLAFLAVLALSRPAEAREPTDEDFTALRGGAGIALGASF